MDARTIEKPGAGPALPESFSPLSAEQVYRRYAPRVYHTVRRMVPSDADAEDVTQDVLLKVVRKLQSFRGEAALPTWLHRVAINAALTHRRRQAVRDERSLGEAALAERPAVARGEGERPEAPLLQAEAQEQIDRAVADLPEAYRAVFVEADVEGRSNAAIAEQMGLSVPAVKSRLHRARQMLRDALAPYFGAAGGRVLGGDG
jgi:RNA polymerase sigma-70 factor (ECF subfamily)